MACKIIAFANQKGGVAKTTSVQNIATILADKGSKVLMIDMDPQASLTISWGHRPEKIKDNIINFLEQQVFAPLKIADHDELYLLPSIIDLATVEAGMMTKIQREAILDKAIKKTGLREKFDFILIDSSPQLGLLSVNILTAADFLVIPCKTDYLSLRGLMLLNNSIGEIKESTNPDLKVLGILATLHNSVTNEDKAVLEQLRTEGNLLGVIKNNQKARDAILAGTSAAKRFPTNKITQQYTEATDNILKAVGDDR